MSAPSTTNWTNTSQTATHYMGGEGIPVQLIPSTGTLDLTDILPNTSRHCQGNTTSHILALKKSVVRTGTWLGNFSAFFFLFNKPFWADTELIASNQLLAEFNTVTTVIADVIGWWLWWFPCWADAPAVIDAVLLAAQSHRSIINLDLLLYRHRNSKVYYQV